MVDGGGVVVVNAGHIGGTRGSGIVSSAADVLVMSVVRMMRGLGLCFTTPVGTRGVLDVCLCLGCGGVVGVDGKWVGTWNRIWTSGVVLCLCEFGFCVYMTVPGISILC